VVSDRVHQRTRQWLRDVPVAGRVEVVLLKRRFACLEAVCPQRTFVQVTDQVLLRARVTTRLGQLVLDAVVTAGRAVSSVAAEHQLGWWTVMGMVNAAALVLADPDTVAVRRLGIDEHRYRSVRYFREPDGSWRRFEPWMSTFVDADTGRVLGVVDGRDSVGVGRWLAARSRGWRDAVARGHQATPRRRMPLRPTELRRKGLAPAARAPRHAGPQTKDDLCGTGT
jgi:transposase